MAGTVSLTSCSGTTNAENTDSETAIEETQPEAIEETTPVVTETETEVVDTTSATDTVNAN